jgi:DNA repair exonuclease SbcCD ATPase subunit
MSSNVSLDQFAQYIEDRTGEIGEVRREAEEIQVGFNSAYVEWKAEHDATLERLVEAVVPRLGELGPDLRGRIEERVVEEQRIIAERREELNVLLIPVTQEEADQLIQQGQGLTEELHEVNPRLDKWEEELKADRAALEAELKQLNERIRRLSGCFVVAFNFFKVSKLDRRRQQVLGELKTLHKELRRVRDEWQEVQREKGGEQQALQSRWQELTVRLAELQGERDYLADAPNRDALALKRATRHVIDNLKETIPCPAADVKAELDRMVQLNFGTDDFEAGLASAVSLLAVLDGIVEGLARLSESVQGLRDEQRMHSAYLPKLSIALPPGVVAFHEQWEGLAQKVRDDGHLCAHPTEFVAVVEPVVKDDLSEANIKAMFEGMGQALDGATRGWRG